MPDPQLELHPEAEANFDSRAQDLLDELAPKENDGRESARSSIPPEAYVSRTITGADIERIETGEVDFAGRRISHFFSEESVGLVGLEGAAYERLQRLSEAFQRAPSIRPYLSERFVTASIFKWLKKSYRGEQDRPMTQFLLTQGRSAVREVEAWIPIPTLSTKVSFQIGHTIFRSITANVMDEWLAEVGSQAEVPPERADEYKKSLRKKVQGLAAGTVSIVAEPIRACEIALKEVEKSTSVLRLFSPGVLHPYGRSFWSPFAFINETGYDVFLVLGGRLQARHAELPLADLASRAPTFDHELLRNLGLLGIDRLHQLLLKKALSSFEEDLLNATLQYSRAALTADPSEKLLYIVSSLESILTRGSEEAGIGKALEERLAMLARVSVAERKDLISRVRRVYKLRSKFVHRALPVEDYRIMSSFMIDARDAFRKLNFATEHYESREDLIAALEEQKLGGTSALGHKD